MIRKRQECRRQLFSLPLLESVGHDVHQADAHDPPWPDHAGGLQQDVVFRPFLRAGRDNSSILRKWNFPPTEPRP